MFLVDIGGNQVCKKYLKVRSEYLQNYYHSFNKLVFHHQLFDICHVSRVLYRELMICIFELKRQSYAWLMFAVVIQSIRTMTQGCLEAFIIMIVSQHKGKGKLRVGTLLLIFKMARMMFNLFFLTKKSFFLTRCT